MTIERAPSTNGHLQHEVAPRPQRASAPKTPPPAAPERTPRRRVGLDARGLALSALVAAAVVFVLRRMERSAAR